MQNKMSQTLITLILYITSIIILVSINHDLSKELDAKNKVHKELLKLFDTIDSMLCTIKEHLGISSNIEAVDFILDAIKEKMDYTSQESSENNIDNNQ